MFSGFLYLFSLFVFVGSVIFIAVFLGLAGVENWGFFRIVVGGRVGVLFYCLFYLFFRAYF